MEITRKVKNNPKRFLGKFGGNEAAFFRSHKIKAQTFPRKLRSIFFVRKIAP